MFLVGNNKEEFLCHPGTSKPYQFETEEQAEYIIKQLGLDNAQIINVSNVQEEERYGGQNDLW